MTERDHQRTRPHRDADARRPAASQCAEDARQIGVERYGQFDHLAHDAHQGVRQGDQQVGGQVVGIVRRGDNNRLYVAGWGIVMVIIACVLQDVVSALTIAYDILVGGLLVPILGGLIWRRGTNVGALAAMAVGTVVTLATMFKFGIEANEPIYFGLACGLVVFVIGSLVSKPTDPAVLAEWDRRSSGREAEAAPALAS